jgi:hypothetical protein
MDLLKVLKSKSKNLLKDPQSVGVSQNSCRVTKSVGVSINSGRVTKTVEVSKNSGGGLPSRCVCH